MASHPLRIAYLNCRIYNYLTATLIEGLTELGQEIYCIEASNYGKSLDEVAWHVFAKQADLILIDTDEAIRYPLLEGLASERCLVIDGSDFEEVNVLEGMSVRLVFKRELNRRAAPHPIVLPFPMAAEKRYFEVTSTIRDLGVVFLANRKTNPLRYSIYHSLLAMGRATGRTDFILGETGERAYRSHSPSGLPIETPVYRSLLCRAKIAVNMPGMGYDCARYWEIPAAGAMLFTWEPDIVIPEPFTDGVNCATFRSIDEFEDKLKFYLAHPEICTKLAAAGLQHLSLHHTTQARAKWFLAQLEQRGMLV